MDICVCARMNGYVDVSGGKGGYVVLYLGRGVCAVRELRMRVLLYACTPENEHMDTCDPDHGECDPDHPSVHLISVHGWCGEKLSFAFRSPSCCSAGWGGSGRVVTGYRAMITDFTGPIEPQEPESFRYLCQSPERGKSQGFFWGFVSRGTK